LACKSNSRSLAVRVPLAGLLVVLASLAGCDESLPPREQNDTYLEASVRSDTAFVDVRIVNAFVDIKNDITISGSVRNLTDEVLSDVADVRLKIVLTDPTNPKRTITLTGTQNNLTGLVQVRNGILTLEPRYGANYRLGWRTQRWANGEDVFHDWRLLVTPVYDPIRHRNLYYLYPPLLLDVKVSAQLFNHTNPVTVSGQIVVLYRIFLFES